MINLREMLEDYERQILSPYATLSVNSAGRDRDEKQCDIRTVFQRDRDRILHSKAFRRLKDKTQVFIMPEGDHYRTRLTHTLEVAQISRTIARALRLNEDLVEAIALGHDLGHTPFGHSGEAILDAICPLGYEHNEQSLRIVEKLENQGLGLNLTKEVRDGILNHQSKGKPATLEGKIVQISDKIAYINHDIDDAIRGHVITAEELPEEFINSIGRTSTERISRIIHDIIENSINTNDIILSDTIRKSIYGIRRFMFEHVYVGSKAKEHEKRAKAMIAQLYEYFIDKPELLPVEYQEHMKTWGDPIERVVLDYIAGMTDRYAIRRFTELFIPGNWKE